MVENVINGPELHREMDSAVGWLQKYFEHRTRNKHQNSDNMSKKTEFYEREEQR